MPLKFRMSIRKANNWSPCHFARGADHLRLQLIQLGNNSTRQLSPKQQWRLDLLLWNCKQHSQSKRQSSKLVWKRRKSNNLSVSKWTYCLEFSAKLLIQDLAYIWLHFLAMVLRFRSHRAEYKRPLVQASGHFSRHCNSIWVACSSGLFQCSLISLISDSAASLSQMYLKINKNLFINWNLKTSVPNLEQNKSK